MPIKTIDGALIGLVKSHLATVASTNNYRDLDNLPSVVSEFENDEGYIKEVQNIPEETVIELWDIDANPQPVVNPNTPITNPEIEELWNLDSDSDSEAIHQPNVPITNPQIVDAWYGNENGQYDDGLESITVQQVEDAWGLNDG